MRLAGFWLVFAVMFALSYSYSGPPPWWIAMILGVLVTLITIGFLLDRHRS